MKTHQIKVDKITGVIESALCNGVVSDIRTEHFCGGSKYTCLRCNKEIEGADQERQKRVAEWQKK